MQEIFLSIWDSAHRFDPSIASETAFVATIARRRSIDMLRMSRPGGEVREPAGQLVAEHAPDRHERLDAALLAFTHLSPIQQDVLRLSIGCSMTYPDIATHLSIPLGTVKTHARRGLALLAEFLADRKSTP